eukprot:TRINITY_DN4954_c0_g1_i4.p1 TRINITY_DN4954_c0_g1~~TRINITY_DN4954_c0_g1_i4.p1  ORF type:complete len:373 (-),score=-13.19 TRINITY_DN4954_c0_g1_i4:142-1260(-)
MEGHAAEAIGQLPSHPSWERMAVPSMGMDVHDILSLYKGQAFVIVDPSTVTSDKELLNLLQLQGYTTESITALFQQCHLLAGYGSPYGIQASTPPHELRSHSPSSNSTGVSSTASSDQNDTERRVEELEEMLKRLNPNAEEFVPPSSQYRSYSPLFGYCSQTRQPKIRIVDRGPARARKPLIRPRRVTYCESVKRTVYISDIEQQVTEEHLATLFRSCGQIVDCRICGDPTSVLRFAFVEFTAEDEAKEAIAMTGTMLGYYPLRVLPSKTSILPVNPKYLPKSEVEREMCARTVYCTNIDKKVASSDVKLFFESICGEVSRIRILGDHRHYTQIAFVEFTMAESAMAALNCSGAVLGGLPLRVCPSKTPLRA